MKLLRKVLQQYQLVTDTWLNDVAKSIWGTTAAVFWAILQGRNHAFETTFIGGACEPVSAGSDNAVILQPGLALVWDDSVSEHFLSKVRPVFLEQTQPVEFTTNNDANDRIDGVFIRPVEVDGDVKTAKFRDPSTQTSYTQDVAHQVDYDWETRVVEGVPSANPQAPTAPSGSWVRVADVTRPSGQVNVTDSDVTDRRTAAPWRLNEMVLDRLQMLDADSDIYFGDPDQSFLKLVVNSGLDALSVVTENQGATPDGTVNVGELWAYVAGGMDELRAITGDIIDVRKDDGSTGAGFDLTALQQSIDAAIDVQDENGNSGKGRIASRSTPKAWGRIDWDSGGSSYSAGNNEGIDSVSRNAAGEVDVTLSQAVASTDDLVVLATANGGTVAACVQVLTTDTFRVSIFDTVPNKIDADFYVQVYY